MTDEDVGTAVGNWVSNAAVKVMTAKLAALGNDGRREISFDQADRFLVGPFAPGDPSMWAGLCLFKNQSYVLYGHARQSWRVGPLEQLRSEESLAPN